MAPYCLDSKTLVLDQSYRPSYVTPYHKAIMMVQRGVAEILSYYRGDTIYTNEMDITQYDLERFGPLGRFFEDELISENRVRVSMDRPAVIRVFTYLKRRPVRFSRQNIFLRDNYECQYEGCKTTEFYMKTRGTRQLPMHLLTFDHIFPKSRGGKTEWTNIVTCCCDCNVRKDNRTPEEAGMKLRRVPSVPTSLPIVKTLVSTPEEWKGWLWMNVELYE